MKSNNQKEHSAIEDFLLCYEAVFNEDGSRKLWEREKCIQLIEIAEKICPDAQSEEFGSKETGYIYEPAIKAIKALKTALTENQML